MYIDPKIFLLLNRQPQKGEWEQEQTGSSPTDSVYRFEVKWFDKTQKKYTVNAISMDRIMKILEKDSL